MKFLTIFLAALILLPNCSPKSQIENKSDLNEKSTETEKISDFEKAEKEYREIYKNIKKLPTPDFTKGIYLTGYTIASEKFEVILDIAQKAGVNTVVFDAKNMEGDVFLSGHQKDTLRAKKYKPIFGIAETVKALHRRNLKAVCRVVVFHDQFLAENFPELRPATVDGNPWRENKRRKPSWMDSSDPEVQSEILEIIERVARRGVDEIQLDYIRFPTQGDLENATFHYQEEDRERSLTDSNYVKREKIDIIETFLKTTKSMTDKFGVKLTADIFAIVAWQGEVDVMNTGQEISRMSKHLDSLHPMIYSSHFGEGFSFREDIFNEPYYIMSRGTRLTIQKISGDCSVIPYIQANSWKVNYGKEYMVAQISAVEDAGGRGFILWNSSNNYDATLMWISEYYNK